LPDPPAGTQDPKVQLVILVSHRISTIRSADHILVLEDGLQDAPLLVHGDDGAVCDQNVRLACSFEDRGKPKAYWRI
jgi:ABC-type protease/lipase transport system fused ATPase/permease subunit